MINEYLPADYIDVYSVIVPVSANLSSDDVLIALWTDFPKWVQFLFKIRDVLVRPFGLQGGGKNMFNDFRQKFTEMVRTGKDLRFMNVPVKNENETIMQLIDKHLTVELSVYFEKINNEQLKISIITANHYHNTFGRFYFFVIKPFHKIIVRAMINNVISKNNVVLKKY